MIDGTYDVSAKTPLGAQSGQIIMAVAGDVCEADLTIGKKTKHLTGTVTGETVRFEGGVKLPFPIGNVTFVIEGTVTGDVLSGVCSTKKFSFDITGTRAA